MTHNSYSSLLTQLKTDPAFLQKEVTKAVRVSKSAIQMDMVRMSSLYMKWAFLSSLAEADVRRQKRRIEEEILPGCRSEAEELCKEQKRKVLKQTLEDIAKEDPGYVSAVTELEDFQLIATILKKVEIALLTKRDMLQSLNSRQKVELVALPHDHDSYDFEDDKESSWRKIGTSTYRMDVNPQTNERLTGEELDQTIEDFETSLRDKWRKEKQE